MAGDESELKEIDEALPSSCRSNKKLRLLFLNKTERDLYVIWLNFEGKRVIYSTLLPNHILPMYTYDGHPWIFEDTKTGDRMLCNGQKIFIPIHNSHTNSEVKGVMVTNPCYSLRECAINTIRDKIRNLDTIDSSQIPDSLLNDIRKAFDLKQKMLNKFEHCQRA